MCVWGGGGEGVIFVNVRCEFVIVFVGGGMDGYIWEWMGIYGVCMKVCILYK